MPLYKGNKIRDLPVTTVVRIRHVVVQVFHVTPCRHHWLFLKLQLLAPAHYSQDIDIGIGLSVLDRAVNECIVKADYMLTS